MNKSGIYKISFGGYKSYVGSAKDLRLRKNAHLHLLRKGISTCVKLQRAFEKYGETSFIFEILENCTEDLLRKREMVWIKKLDSVNNGYNTALDTSIPMLGRKHSEATKKVMSAKALGNKGRTGQKLTEEHIEQMREARKGVLVGISNNVGEKNAGAKLTKAEVISIFRLKDKMPQSEIALYYSIAQQTVSKIHTGKKWAHVTKNLKDE